MPFLRVYTTSVYILYSRSWRKRTKLITLLILWRNKITWIKVFYFTCSSLNYHLFWIIWKNPKIIRLHISRNFNWRKVESLQEAQEHDIIHRNIKYGNIMVKPKWQVKVMDFGLAKLKGMGGLTKASTTMTMITCLEF